MAGALRRAAPVIRAHGVTVEYHADTRPSRCSASSTATDFGLVFPAPHGGPVRSSQFRRRFWTPAVDAAGLAPLRFHDLRHTAVVLWIASGATSKDIAARAGHSSVSTVLDRYGHLLPERRGEVTDRLDAMAKGAALPRPDAQVVNLDQRR